MEDRLEIPDSTNIQILSTTDGSSYVGRVVSVTDREIRFKTSLGTTTIPRSSISALREVQPSWIVVKSVDLPNLDSRTVFEIQISDIRSLTIEDKKSDARLVVLVALVIIMGSMLPPPGMVLICPS